GAPTFFRQISKAGGKGQWKQTCTIGKRHRGRIPESHGGKPNPAIVRHAPARYAIRRPLQGEPCFAPIVQRLSDRAYFYSAPLQSQRHPVSSVLPDEYRQLERTPQIPAEVLGYQALHQKPENRTDFYPE